MQFPSWLSRCLWVIPILVVTTYGWVLYPLLRDGYFAGPYLIAVFYSQFMGSIELFLLLLNWYTFIPMAAISLFCLTIPKRYRRSWQRRLRYWPILPLTAFMLAPSLITLQPGSALEIQPWHQTYYTAFSTLRTDDNYGDELLIQCRLSGLLCRSVYNYHTSNPFYRENTSSTNSDFFAIHLAYGHEIDQLQVKLYGEEIVYARSRDQEICNMGSTPRQDCERNLIP
ncbi:hypothetical protein [Acaryochloris sp. IP29b_bin.137]|uniref:hypothetical protein n=1 Tax=Acaryochloris sp. IP29b_bin.137 TaxID=2969217 RepID=UPI002611B983|nr:hypothetical protein [Acaryochloris sp. IP29b_bin.137]